MCTKITPATQVPASTETPVPEKPTSDQVKWNVSEEKFMGAYSQTNEETGEPEIFSKELSRKYVSFSPWPTTGFILQQL